MMCVFEDFKKAFEWVIYTYTCTDNMSRGTESCNCSKNFLLPKLRVMQKTERNSFMILINKAECSDMCVCGRRRYICLFLVKG